jgi:hypothetical protein
MVFSALLATIPSKVDKVVSVKTLMEELAGNPVVVTAG